MIEPNIQYRSTKRATVTVSNANAKRKYTHWSESKKKEKNTVFKTNEEALGVQKYNFSQEFLWFETKREREREREGEIKRSENETRKELN